MAATPAKASKNGDADGNIATLQAVFKSSGFIFRHYPEGKLEWLRWQALKPLEYYRQRNVEPD